MTARLSIRGVVRIPLRNLFVVHGDIMDGTVAAGQIPWSTPVLDRPVDSIESMLLDASTGASTVALCFRYLDDTEFLLWQAAIEGKDVLELREPNEPVPRVLGVGAALWSDGKRRNPPAKPGEYPRSSE